MSKSTHNTGGPAFPEPHGKWNEWGGYLTSSSSMTLRDYFAAKAMAALITEPVSEAYESMVQAYSRDLDVKGLDAFAHVAYMIADAMLKAREGGQ